MSRSKFVGLAVAGVLLSIGCCTCGSGDAVRLNRARFIGSNNNQDCRCDR